MTLSAIMTSVHVAVVVMRRRTSVIAAGLELTRSLSGHVPVELPAIRVVVLAENCRLSVAAPNPSEEMSRYVLAVVIYERGKLGNANVISDSGLRLVRSTLPAVDMKTKVELEGMLMLTPGQ
jgi:hypothetical protein